MFETPRYRVSGTQPVFDHQPGEEFEADLDPSQERFLLSGGHLERVDAKPAKQRANPDKPPQAADHEE